jgi:hypothetical protein
MPRMLSFNLKTRWFFQGEIIIIDSKANLLSFLNDLFESIPNDKIFLKPMMGQGGQGCLLLKKNNLNTELESIYTTLISNSYMIQAHIQQHESINIIFDKSVNTLRMDTYIDKNNTSHVLSALMRFGIGKNITDNTHTGGFYVAINESGQLSGIGRQDVVKGGGVFTRHQDSDYILEGFHIPYFKEACELILQATTYFPNRIVGWDMAITPLGPVIIEGNHNPSLHVTDVAYGGYLNHPLIKEILNEIKN